jgi:hypothetical protein
MLERAALAARPVLVGRELLAAVSAAGRDDLAAAGGGHAGAEAVTALTHELAGLIGSLHGAISEWSRIDPGCTDGRAGYSLARKCVCKREQRPSRAPRRDGAAYDGWGGPSQFQPAGFAASDLDFERRTQAPFGVSGRPSEPSGAVTVR